MNKQTANAPNVDTDNVSLPQWMVLVHNDDVNTFEYVINCFMEIAGMKLQQAVIKTLEVDKEGVSVIKITHKEYAEFIMEQLKSCGLSCSIEPTCE